MANPPGFYTVVVGPAGFTDSPIVSAELSAVVFADGELELRGADIFGFQKSIERALAAIVGCGNMARAGQWLELEARAQSQDNSKFESMHEQGSAKDLVFLRNWKSEIAARDLGDRFRTLPTKLWRKGQ